MSLNMYIGEVQAQTESMNNFCYATIQGMEEVIRSIDAFALDITLKGTTYDSAKTFFMQTYRQLAQGIIYLCEELTCQNTAFPAAFQAEVATVDVIEQEIHEQIRELECMIAAIEAISEQTPGAAAMPQIYHSMKQKLEDKLERLYQFNHSSSENYSTAIKLASSIAKGLAEVQSGKGFSSVSGTFSVKELNMEWAASIHKVTKDKAHEAQIKELMTLQEQEANKPWYQKTAISAWEFIQGASSAVVENLFGLEPPYNDELKNKLNYQIGRFGGSVLTGIVSIVEIFGGLTVIGGINLLTLVTGVGTFGAAAPIVIPLDIAVTAAGAGVVTHGGYVWYNTVQSGKDSLQKFQSSSSSSESTNNSKGTSKTRFTEEGWSLSEGGGKINGRNYSQHSLERMAPDTLEVKATLTSRAIKKAEELGLKPRTKEYSDFIKKYVDPRNVPPSVIEDAIKNSPKIPGNRVGTFIHETKDVKVIINELGDVITVIPK